MNINRKRKIDVENRKFQSKWEMEYLFVESNGKPQCLVCMQVLSVLKEFNIGRHYNALHKAKYDGCIGDARAALIEDMKSKIKQKKVIIRAPTSQSASLTASYEVCLQLAKCKKPFRDGEVVKHCAAKMARAFGDEKMARNFESVSLSHQIVARRISDMNVQVNAKLRTIVQTCKYFSLAVAESTDFTDVSQLLIFIRTIDEDFSVYEELLELVPLNTSKKGLDIYEALTSAVSEYGGFQKCSCIVTDGTKSMTFCKNGLVGLLKENGIECTTLHSIIHQESLCEKSLKMSNVMTSVIKVINIICGENRAQSQRKFIQFINFLEELDAEYGDLPLYSEVRWLSASKCLMQYFAFRKDVLSFLKKQVRSNTTQFEEELENPTYLCSLAFLTDITSHFNVINLRLQDRNQNISNLVEHVDWFRRKLELLNSSLLQNDLTHFPSCKELADELDEADFRSFSEIITELLDEFSARFADLEGLRASLQLFNNPMDVSIERQSKDLQMELCELQGDPFFLSRKNEIPEIFWKRIPKDCFPKLNDFALKMCSMFASTYISESTFSTMKQLKAKHHNKLDRDTLGCCLRLATTEFEVDILALVQEKHFPQCSQEDV
ncbi:general transcription factor II-I repeat domain-containing protein 2A-like [Callorhinchus milii]|uniref:HAT C-terminal dimerisation domain-containing protein n=1 Tax=Callorhinchus milii TaxID=7868 RepID=A0A4W3H513_CALMI|nr:general transcription factor II-I repeat domain-containing protein 2A-like [Callorhinchus milii]